MRITGTARFVVNETTLNLDSALDLLLQSAPWSSWIQWCERQRSKGVHAFTSFDGEPIPEAQAIIAEIENGEDPFEIASFGQRRRRR